MAISRNFDSVSEQNWHRLLQLKNSIIISIMIQKSMKFTSIRKNHGNFIIKQSKINEN
jgi:hypothetical protein